MTPDADGPSALFRIEGAGRTFRMGEVNVQALVDVDLTIADGEMMVILGPSGSGKSTLLNLIGGMDRPTAGRVWHRDVDLTGMTDGELTEYRRTQVGFVFQFYNLVPTLTAYENVQVATELVAATSGRVGGRFAGRGTKGGKRAGVRHRRSAGASESGFAGASEDVSPERFRRGGDGPTRAADGDGNGATRRVLDPAEALAMVGLADRAEHFPAQLSGGEQQRVAVARALAKGPELLLADEPTGALDIEASRHVLGLLQRLNRERGLTVIIITHNPAIADIAGRIVRLASGHVTEVQVNERPAIAADIEW